MFITVRFGDDNREIFNPNCKICSLLTCIKEKCDCDKEDVIDLSDSQGVRKNLTMDSKEYAIKYIDEREVLILVRIERFPGALNETCVPLLHELQGDKDFLENLNKNMRVEPNSELEDKIERQKRNITGRRASMNIRNQKNTLNVGNQKRRVSRSQSIALGTGTNLVKPSRKPRQ